MHVDIKEIKEKNKFLRWLYLSLTIFFVIVILYIAGSLALAQNYKNKIYPEVYVTNINLGGLTKTQAQNIIEGQVKQSYNDGFYFYYAGAQKKIPNVINNQTIFDVNSDIIIEKAWQVGRNNNWFFNDLKLPVSFLYKKLINVDYKFDKNLLKEEVKSIFAITENPAINAGLIINITDPTTKTYEIEFTDSKIGETYDLFTGLEKLEASLKNLNNTKIYLQNKTDYPQITKPMAETQIENIKDLLTLEDINFFFEDKKWEISWTDFTHWIQVSLNDKEEIITTLNEGYVKNKLISIAQEIDQEAVDAKLLISNDKVVEFQSSKNGIKVNLEESYNKIIEEIVKNKQTNIELIAEVTKPNKNTSDVNTIGINEKLGMGYSNFGNSPSNRIHNIGIGAATLNGLLIKPGEEFSLVGSLGEIDGQHGYKPELVIKKEGTVAEYGGGLCQIATTLFRSVLDSGLKITQRRNHSYRVSYYEPAGTDATIYDPWPDLRFINDTENYILIQTQISGNDLYFEIWGTNDGRDVRFEGNNKVTNFIDLKPIIFNITGPGPAKYIETSELAPGVKRKQESAHNGADAVFYQIIKKPGQEEEKITWSSHYVPWQEVWLIGVDPAKKQEEATQTTPDTQPNN